MSGVQGRFRLALIGPASQPLGWAADTASVLVQNAQFDHPHPKFLVAQQFVHGAASVTSTDAPNDNLIRALI